MRKTIILGLFLLATLSLIQAENYSPRTGKIPKNSVKEFDITVSTSYYDKWRPVFNLYGNQFRQAIRKFKESMIQEGIMDGLWSYFVTNYSKYYYLYDKEFFEEMQTISILGLTQYQDVFTYNFMYELVAHEQSTIKMCTAVLLRQQDGEIVHQKNLDFMHPESFAPIIVKFNVWDDAREKLLYSYVTGTGQVSANSGIRHNGYSYTLNQRNKGLQSQNLVELLLGAMNVQISLTRALKNNDNYKDYIKEISSQSYISPFYLTVASANPEEGGVLIEMDRNKVFQVKELSEENWYIIQTNYDLDEQDYDYRKTFGTWYIEQIGRSATRYDVHNLLENFPIFNNITLMTVDMDPRKGQIIPTIYW